MLRSNTPPLMPAVLLAALACAMWLESSALAKEFLVTSLEDAGEGSLRAAVKSANECPGSDLIRFKKQLRGTISLTTGQIEITDDLKLAGPGEFRLTVSGNHRSRIFQISKDVSVSIEDLAIVDGMNTVQESIGIKVTRGGAILNDGGTLNVLRVTFRDNVTINVTTDEVDSDVTGGGAIVNSGSAKLTAINCRFMNNHASGGTRYAFGGAIGNVTESKAYVTNCLFAANVASLGATSYGGAIGNLGGSQLTVLDCSFYENSARGTESGQKAFGGAVATRPGTVDGSGSLTTITRSLLVANYARATSQIAGGGALSSYDSSLILRSSTLVENKAEGESAYGGALYAFGSANESFFPFVSLTDCDFRGNTALAIGVNGKAFGGGLNNGPETTMELRHTSINCNEAIGGEGVGGGLYTLGFAEADKWTLRKIVDNKSSTSNADVYGTVDIY
jgi:hypothetical protein